MKTAPLSIEFAAVAQRHQRVLLSIVRNYAPAAERDDLLQDILLALWHTLPGFERRSTEITFIYRVALNTALAWRRRPRSLGESDEDSIADAISSHRQPDAALMDAEREAALAVAISRLSLVDRSLVLMHLDDLSYRDIAEVLGLSETNVGARLTRARRRLSSLMQGV